MARKVEIVEPKSIQLEGLACEVKRTMNDRKYKLPFMLQDRSTVTVILMNDSDKDVIETGELYSFTYKECIKGKTSFYNADGMLEMHKDNIKYLEEFVKLPEVVKDIFINKL